MRTARATEGVGDASASRAAALYERNFGANVIRFTLARTEWAALVGAALIVLLQQIDSAGAALEYRRALLAAQPWRVVTAHLVHVNWEHALINAAAWWLVARLFGPDLEEVAPAYDHAEVTCIAASHVVYELLALMAVDRP